MCYDRRITDISRCIPRWLQTLAWFATRELHARCRESQTFFPALRRPELTVPSPCPDLKGSFAQSRIERIVGSPSGSGIVGIFSVHKILSVLCFPSCVSTHAYCADCKQTMILYPHKPGPECLLPGIIRNSWGRNYTILTVDRTSPLVRGTSTGVDEPQFSLRFSTQFEP